MSNLTILDTILQTPIPIFSWADLQCTIDMGMHHGHAAQAWIHAWMWTCSMDVVMQHGRGMHKDHRYGHASWTWACTMEMGMHHGNVHAPWKWARAMEMGMRHGNGHAPWISTCTMDMDMQIGHGQDHRHGHTVDYHWTAVVGRNYAKIRNNVYIGIVITSFRVVTKFRNFA